jgi:hypothetical protein
MKIQELNRILPQRNNSHYLANRSPLQQQPLIPLPLNAVKPSGWLAHQLELMCSGMTGKLKELSSFLTDDTGWLGGDGPAWEEQPYWFRGFYDLGVLTGNPEILLESDRWIESILKTSDPEGYFGGKQEKEFWGKNGRSVRDLWPPL